MSSNPTNLEPHVLVGGFAPLSGFRGISNTLDFLAHLGLPERGEGAVHRVASPTRLPLKSQTDFSSTRSSSTRRESHPILDQTQSPRRNPSPELNSQLNVQANQPLPSINHSQTSRYGPHAFPITGYPALRWR
ncbi:hypothetical protein JMJ77_0010878 [Colletotrichum scovillei]|uniref:Uncharacterized protein n=1 Tax=Colletotrichum scovillei TaxID=1209932 RepID=A0A9P7U9I8_9PEZI|nr:hypothetical protein JMJ77_0010878 [Colletotrichum scovillei]KAG7059874.1 hypothetical protein JMJ78_0015160 [Colletotrichum scovillei]KAG7067294.1 hypothetical protein JMJ76_0008734 [Colletotrichum scovillei]